jgi:RNA polymerase sigma-B factor
MDHETIPDDGLAPVVPPTRVEVTRTRSAALFLEFRDGDAPSASRDAARDALVHLHLPLVEHCARRFRNRGEPFEDLVQVGTIGLIKSIDRFEPDRGVEFSTYATPTIIGEIKRYFRDKGWAIRVPRRLQELRMQIGAASAELTQSLGRSPTPRELAENLGCTVE